MKRAVNALQPIGRALMLPIAVLPVAALLLRLGQPDLLGIPAVAAAGDAIFSNLGLLFAIGVAVGLARENHGAAGLASVVGYLVTTKGAEVLIAVPPEVTASLSGQAQELAIAAFRAKELAKLSVPAGLLSGLIAGWAYNRYSDIRLPSYLAFFGGRRFVPIVSGAFGILLAVCFGFAWPVLERGMDAGSQGILASDSFGLFAYGILNRVLIVTGLHHIVNNIAWFLIGDYNGVTGDLKRFFAGDPSAGAFMSGFFPVMMFGLPAACLAMYRTARPERRKAVGGLLLSMALTAFLTGVTEPIEFAFMFQAPVLYALHAVLTGIAMAGMHLLDVRLGFGFSAGLFDYLLNFSLAERPLWLLPIGLVYAGIYYTVFRWFILRFDLRTPGREREDQAASVIARGLEPAQRWIRALGGAANVRSIDACMTRLRLTVADQHAVQEDALKQLGGLGVVRPSAQALQVVVGPVADQLAADIRASLNMPAGQVESASTASNRCEQLLIVAGGAENVVRVELCSTRLCLTLSDPARVQEQPLRALGVRGTVRPTPHSLHVIVGPSASALFGQVEAALAVR